MKRNIRLSFIVYALFCVCGSLHALGEETLVIGGRAGWDDAVIRQGVTEAVAVRPTPVMALASGGQALSGGKNRAVQTPVAGTGLDLDISFDEGSPELFTDRTGRYLVTANSSISAVTQRRARTGTGAAHFAGNASRDLLAVAAEAEPFTIIPIMPQALLAPNRRLEDFTLEFWLNGENMENGEQFLFWSATRFTVGGSYVAQRIQAIVSRNRLQWVFQDFFTDPYDQDRLSLSFRGITPLTPRTWSHHLIRFDSGTGLLEYLVDGQTETIVYATSSGREGGEVFTPVTGQGSKLILGNRFAGMIDEFRLYSSFAGNSSLQKYPRGGGRLETRFLDLGDGNNEILRVEARGGRVSYPAGKNTNSRERVISAVPAGDRAFSFPDDSAIRFFVRTSETPFPRTSGS
ncbi:MAG: LamG domain-containing protein, partial [Treponema sp.]|nr:LamG domain-containing protein [Treponema sp.]